MENLVILKIEIITTIISFCYIVFFYFEKLYFSKIKPKIKEILLKEVDVEEVPKQTVNIEEKEHFYKKEAGKKKKLSMENKEKLEDIIKRVTINSAKGYLDTAKSLIIEGLALDKTNRTLNIELASIYEREKKYKNAEYIYFDLIESKDDNFEILKKLGYVLAMQKEYKKSIKIYSKALNKKSDDVEVLEMLTDLNYEILDFKGALKYAKLYLREKPKDLNKQIIEGICLENTGKIEEAIEAYKNILELQPYNSEIIERLKRLENNEIEEEMEKKETNEEVKKDGNL